MSTRTVAGSLAHATGKLHGAVVSLIPGSRTDQVAGYWHSYKLTSQYRTE